MQGSNVRFKNKYTKRSSNTLLHLVYLFSKQTLCSICTFSQINFGVWKHTLSKSQLDQNLDEVTVYFS